MKYECRILDASWDSDMKTMLEIAHQRLHLLFSKAETFQIFKNQLCTIIKPRLWKVSYKKKL